MTSFNLEFTFPGTLVGNMRRPAWHRLVLLLLGLASIPPDNAKAASEPTSSKDLFKLLLQSPPAIEHLVFREKLAPVLNQPVPLSEGISRSTNFASYQLTWQTNGMLVRRLPDTPDLISQRLPKVAFNRLYDNFWFLDAGTNVYFYQLEHERARAGFVPPAYDAAWFRITRYGEILNLGLSHLWPGTVRWEADRFNAWGIADKKPLRVCGEITQLSNGMPTELRVTYSNNMGIAWYRIVYDYRNRDFWPYPNRVTSYWKAPQREIEYRAYEITELRLARRPLPDEVFRPTEIGENPSRVRYFTNNSVYIRLPSGRMLEAPGAGPKLALTRADYYRNRYFYVASTAVTVAFVALGIKLKPGQSNQGGKPCNQPKRP